MSETRELSKTYSAADVEDKWYECWDQNGYFKPRSGKRNQTFSIIMPPPNVTGVLHMGHALDATTQDVLVRYKRMKGYETLFIPGTDHAGIATQAKVEAKLYSEQKKTKHDVGRDTFIKLLWDWKKEHGDTIVEQQKKTGLSCDWDYSVFTMDELPHKAVTKTFVDWYNEGLIFQSDYIINWDPTLQSAISDAEVVHEEVKGAFYHIKYQVMGTETFLEVATTRPETLLGDTAVAVNPKDDRFKHLIGKKAIVPIVNREVPIIGDEHVDVELGTGCLKVTPGHDFNDFEIGQRNNLEIINILNKDGTLNEVAPEFTGLSCKEARPKVCEKLKELGLYVKEVETVHQVGHGERSGEVVEPMVSKQWFVDTEKMAADACKAVEDGDMVFFPKGWENTYYSYMRNPRRWCISRQLWWGHQIPVFNCQDCGHQYATEQSDSECPKCQSKNIQQDPDVLDTWFSSGLWAMSTLGWPDPKAMEEKRFHDFFPTTTLITGFDIIFFWVARMMMMTLKTQGQVPFKHTYIHAIVRDKLGRKMSKSLGNGLDPLEVISQYGADAMRFTLAAGSGYNRGLNLDPTRIEGYRNFINKLWNAFRFVSPFLKDAKGELPANLHVHDKWVLSELNEMAKKMNDSLDVYRYDDACAAMYAFVYDKFCSWYIELSKKVLYSENEEAKRERVSVLKYLLRQVMALLHPVIPFITEEIWSHIKEENDDLLIIQNYPEFNQEQVFDKERDLMNCFIETVSQVRNLRQSVNMKPKEKIELHLHLDDDELSSFYQNNLIFFEDLAGVSKVIIAKKDSQRPGKSLAAATAHNDIFIPLEGLIDIDEQIRRVEKDLAKTQKELERSNKKLTNKNFVDKAPPEVIDEVKEKAELFKHKCNSLQEMLESLKN